MINIKKKENIPSVNENKREIRIYDDRIEDLAKRIAEKMGVQKDKVETELRIGIVIGMMMNRHIISENADIIE